MADGKLTLTVVTPEQAVVEGISCDEVTLPTLNGEIGILPGHTPLITLLGIGVVGYRDGATRGNVAVREGFAEIAADVVRVLADRAASKENVDRPAAERGLAAAQKRHIEVVGDEELAQANADQGYAEARLKLGA
jgi:F-type H+-transporting ATPase subunit epsilon